MSPQETDTLRKEIKKTMVDLDLAGPGSYDVILPHLNARLSRKPVTRNILSMAMTGYREYDGYVEILKELQVLLATWPPKEMDSPSCAYTRGVDAGQ